MAWLTVAADIPTGMTRVKTHRVPSPAVARVAAEIIKRRGIVMRNKMPTRESLQANAQIDSAFGKLKEDMSKIAAEEESLSAVDARVASSSSSVVF